MNSDHRESIEAAHHKLIKAGYGYFRLQDDTLEGIYRGVCILVRVGGKGSYVFEYNASGNSCPDVVSAINIHRVPRAMEHIILDINDTLFYQNLGGMAAILMFCGLIYLNMG